MTCDKRTSTWSIDILDIVAKRPSDNTVVLVKSMDTLVSIVINIKTKQWTSHDWHIFPHCSVGPRQWTNKMFRVLDVVRVLYVQVSNHVKLAAIIISDHISYFISLFFFFCLRFFLLLDYFWSLVLACCPSQWNSFVTIKFNMKVLSAAIIHESRFLEPQQTIYVSLRCLKCHTCWHQWNTSTSTVPPLASAQNVSGSKLTLCCVFVTFIEVPSVSNGCHDMMCVVVGANEDSGGYYYYYYCNVSTKDGHKW